MTGKRLLSLLLCLLLAGGTLLCAAPAFAQEKEGSAMLTATKEIVLGDAVVLSAETDDLDTDGMTYDYLVKKPGAEKYTYLKKGSTSASIRYRPKETGEYRFCVRAWEKGADTYVSSKAVKTLVSEAPADASVLWDPTEGYGALPTQIASYEEAKRALSTAVATYRVLSPLKAPTADSYMDQLMAWEPDFHNGFLLGGYVSFYVAGRGSNTTLTFTYDYDAAGQLVRKKLFGEPTDGKKETAAFEESVQKILSYIDIEEKSDYDKARTIHDYLVSHYRYDTGDYDETDGIDGAFTAMGLINDGEAVCEGYSELFALLCILSDLPAYTISGSMDGGPHMWNLVRIDGAWYHVDCTGDDPVPDKAGRIYRTYFLKSDDFMREKDYVWVDEYFVDAPASYQK